jgi:hypothetical protein
LEEVFKDVPGMFEGPGFSLFPATRLLPLLVVR